MRYFKYDLWINDAEDEWRENGLKYSAYFETIKDDLPQDFLKAYYSAQDFHDYEIRSVKMSDEDTLVLELFSKQKRMCIEYKNVTDISLVSQGKKLNKDMQISEYLEWGYDEFFKEKDGSFTHCILTSCGLEISVTFKAVRVSDMKCVKPHGTVMYF